MLFALLPCPICFYKIPAVAAVGLQNLKLGDGEHAPGRRTGRWGQASAQHKARSLPAAREIGDIRLLELELVAVKVEGKGEKSDGNAKIVNGGKL
jgi:hypothetical protein